MGERARSIAIGEARLLDVKGEALSRQSVRSIWRRVAERAGIPDCERHGWHSCRRAFANRLRHATLRGRADHAFRPAGVLPPEVLADVAEDPFHSKPAQEPDWFIESLLTSRELSSILRLPAASVRALGIKSVQIAGETRYRQSVVRAYLIEQESAETRRSIVSSVGMASSAVSEQRTHPQARRFKSFYNRER